MSKKAIVLLSGGLDSATALYWAKSQGYQCYCLIFDYGQRHRKEIAAAKKIAGIAGCHFSVISIRLGWDGGSTLLDKNRGLPDTPIDRIGQGPIPSTYVSGRNTLFVAYAISAADATGAQAIVIGANQLDYSGYPDCRPNYYKAFQKVAELGTRRGAEGKPLRILTPLIELTKAAIVKLGQKLDVPWELTWSCYQGGRKPCRRCDSCKLRAKGFQEAIFSDPVK